MKNYHEESVKDGWVYWLGVGVVVCLSLYLLIGFLTK